LKRAEENDDREHEGEEDEEDEEDDGDEGCSMGSKQLLSNCLVGRKWFCGDEMFGYHYFMSSRYCKPLLSILKLVGDRRAQSVHNDLLGQLP